MIESAEPDPLIAPIRDASRRLVRELGFMKSTLAGTALPPSAVHTLVEIGARGSLTSAELCDVLALEKSSVSRMVRKLVEDGELAEGTSDRDGRAKPLSLTSQGEATLGAIDSFAEQQVIAALEQLDRGARRIVLDGLALYASALAASRLGERSRIASQCWPGGGGRPGEWNRAGEQSQNGDQSRSGEESRFGEESWNGKWNRAGEQSRSVAQGWPGQPGRSGEQKRAAEQSRSVQEIAPGAGVRGGIVPAGIPPDRNAQAGMAKRHADPVTASAAATQAEARSLAARSEGPTLDEITLTALAGGSPVIRPSGRLSGKVCLVTGGGSGIGRAAALRFASEGAASVLIGGRRVAEGEAVAAEIRAAGTDALFVQTDVTQETDVAVLVSTAVRQFGRLDVAFNNAGFQERRASLGDQDDAIYAKVFDTNVRALCHCLRHEVAAMLACGGGSIVNNTSVSGVRNPNAGLSLYAASKAAAITLTRSAAMEYAPRGVRINAVAPGRVVTDMMLASGIADMAQVAAGLPLKRMGRPEEVAAAVCWLLSDEASYVVGHVLCADGGFLAA
jgi:NAD(P)-dependent dehydrogenase (short-subunit alcohol dehydrogenase family)/DNA-binding MarR family transcriptional regulator